MSIFKTYFLFYSLLLFFICFFVCLFVSYIMVLMGSWFMGCRSGLNSYDRIIMYKPLDYQRTLGPKEY